MSHSEDRQMDFVLRHYKEGAFDTQKAVDRFMEARGMRPKTRRRFSPAYVAVSAAAALLVGVFIFKGLDSRRWTEVATASVQQTVVLPDGTDVTLAAGSVLKYRMKDRREVKMEGKVFRPSLSNPTTHTASSMMTTPRRGLRRRRGSGLPLTLCRLNAVRCSS